MQQGVYKGLIEALELSVFGLLHAGGASGSSGKLKAFITDVRVSMDSWDTQLPKIPQRDLRIPGGGSRDFSKRPAL